jgi:hypothetical protein
MTLKDKFRPLVWFNSGSFNVHQNKEKDENSIKCEKIADDYAIEFAEWVIKGKIDKQLLEIFKKERNL